MVENVQAVQLNDNAGQSPQFYTPPPPPGEPPATSLTSAQPSAQTVDPPANTFPQSSPLATHAPQTSVAMPSTNPFSDAAAPAQPDGLEGPPQHPDRPLPVGGLTETPFHSEPVPILPPRPPAQPEQQSQVLPPPRASFDQPIPDHPAMRQSSLGRAQSPSQTIQHVAMTPAQPQPVAPAPQAPILDSNAQTLESDPAISSLHAMFPDFDLLVIQSVLEATGGDKDQAVDSLLAMSDPEYAQSQAQAPAQPQVMTTATTGIGAGTGNQGRPPTQTELDEEFARRLMLEEEQQANASSWPPTGGQYNQPVPYQQYQPRRSGEHQRPPSGGTGGGFGDMAGDLQQQFRSFIGGTSARRGPQPGTQTQGTGGAAGGAGYQDQFNKIADTGKKTFNTIFNKVKQKMEEFDNRHPSDTQNMNQPQQSGHWSNWQAPAPVQQQQVPTYAQSPGPQYAPPAQSPPPISHGALNSNPYGIPASAPSANPDPNPNAGAGAGGALPSSSSRWQYQPDQPETLPPVPAPTVSGATEEPRRSLDATRLGLLPKRPVSLMDVNAGARPAQTQPPTHTHAQDSDNESLEYVDRPMPGSMARP